MPKYVISREVRLEMELTANSAQEAIEGAKKQHRFTNWDVMEDEILYAVDVEGILKNAFDKVNNNEKT